MTLYLQGVTFVAVPKTGTIAIEKAFAPYASNIAPLDAHKHDNVAKVKLVSSNPCLCLVRNPLDWIGSYYRFLRFSPFFARSDCLFGIHSKSFEDFVQAHVRGRRMWPEPHRFQHEYVCSGGLSVEWVYRYDALTDAMDHLSEVCGVAPKIDKHNVSRKLELELSEGTRLQFEKYMEKDYCLYEQAMSSRLRVSLT